jgi:DNA-binding winged helix-turn-helix (wHTH) protein/tetratricopeptide (TPR) repeat protein
LRPNHDEKIALFRFGLFEVDLRAREIRKEGVKVRLQDQPFELLLLLAGRPGELVTREELRSHLWPSDTFVDFDNALNTAVNKVRDALGDSAENPRFIETVPRRGYRFIAPATAVATVEPGTAPSDASTIGSSGRARRWAMTVAVAILVIAAGAALWRSRTSPTSGETDTIVLTDFDNETGEQVFDGTLRRGLAVELEQSPFFRLLPEGDIQRVVRLMKKPADLKLTQAVAAEICQRAGASIVLVGSIAQVGTDYTLTLRASSCSNGRTLASTEATSPDRSHVLDALNRASREVRRILGESRTSIERFDTPLAQASTSSLEALRFYTAGYQALVGRGDSASAIPFFRNAIALDDNFAMAYALLGDSLWNIGETKAASASIGRAYDLRTGVSEPERLRIESEYHSFGTGDLEKASLDFTVWADTYPRDCGPRNQLGVVHTVLGQFDKALQAFEEAARLCPQSALIRGNLTYAFIALNRLREARASVEQTLAQNAAGIGTRIDQYRLAFLDGNTDAMRQIAAETAGDPGFEDALQWNQAATASYFGEFDRSRTLLNQAVAVAGRSMKREAAANYETSAALAAGLCGFIEEARRLSDSALQRSNGVDVTFRAAVALAITGDRARPQLLADDLAIRFPEDTLVQAVYVPTIRSQVAMTAGNNTTAIDIVQSALPYEQGVALLPAYVRGMALLHEQRADAAMAEFDKIIANPGIVLNSVIGALAVLQEGRAFVAQRNVSRARDTYLRFFDVWKHADPDIPILAAARQEYAALR